MPPYPSPRRGNTPKSASDQDVAGLPSEVSIETIQKQILTTILHKNNLVGSFPISQPLAPLYAVPALTGKFLVLVVVPDRLAVQRNLEQFKRNGIYYPQVAALDGSQPPHTERETLEHVKHREVSILYTVPDAFGSIHFLQRLVHLNLACVVVEQAHYLIPGTSLNYRYQRFYSGWNAISKRPPLVLLTPPIPNRLKAKLVENLNLPHDSITSVQVHPSLEQCLVTARRCISEKQKFQVLLQALQGELLEMRFPGVDMPPPPPTQTEAITPTIVHTMDIRTAERLTRALQKQGYSSVYTYHAGLSWPECNTIERIFQHEPHTILVSAYYASHFFKHHTEYPLKNIFWNMHPGLYELTAQAFPWKTPVSTIGTLLLYSKEDYKRNLSLINTQVWDDEEMAQEDLDWTMARLKDEPLPALRRWVLSESCRWATLCQDVSGVSSSQLPPCGICDRCRTPSFGLVWDGILKHWLY